MSRKNIDIKIHMIQRTQEEGVEYHYKKQDMKKFVAPNNKMVLIAGGNNTNCTQASNGNAKVIETLLSDYNKEKTSIYSLWYESEPISSRTKMLSDEYREEFGDVFEHVVKPIFLDDFGNLKHKKGIEKVLKDLVLVSHCGGAEFINIIIDKLYELFASYYPEAVANQLCDKIQYFAYAPSVLPNKKVNAFVVAPFFDAEFSCTKVLNMFDGRKIDCDFPRGSMKKIMKSYEKQEGLGVFEELFKLSRMVVFKADQNICLIPNRLNADRVVGDHSIDCLTKSNVLQSGTDNAKTAKLVNFSSSLILNQFLNNSYVDYKGLYENITKKLDNKEKRTNTYTAGSLIEAKGLLKNIKLD